MEAAGRYYGKDQANRDTLVLLYFMLYRYVRDTWRYVNVFQLIDWLSDLINNKKMVSIFLALYSAKKK